MAAPSRSSETGYLSSAHYYHRGARHEPACWRYCLMREVTKGSTMNRAKRTKVTVVAVVVLASLALVMTDAAAQSRGRSIRIPSRSGSGLRLPSAVGRSGRSGLSGLSGLSGRSGRNGLSGLGSLSGRSGNIGNPFSGSSRSGFRGLEGLGALLDEASRNYGYGGYGPWDHHDQYSHAEAYRDVGIANAVVDLVGVLVNASAYQTYAPVAAAPVEVVPAPVAPVPVPSAGPVTVVPAPTVIVQTPAYYAPPPYVHLTPPPVPMPYPRAYTGHPGPSSYSRYQGGHRYYKTPAPSRSGPAMTPRRSPITRTSPAASRGRMVGGQSSVRSARPSVQRTPVKTSSWSYRVR